MRVVIGSTLALTALVALVMRHTFDGTGWVNSFVLCLGFEFALIKLK